MLTKLLKYDTFKMIKNMMAFYVLSIIFSTMYRLIGLFNETTIIITIKNVLLGCTIAMIVNIVINTIIRSFVRFKESLYGDEAYLTHTLPVSKTTIYESKFIQTIIFTVGSLIVALVSAFIAFYTYELWDKLKISAQAISTGLDVKTVFILIGLAAIIIIEAIDIIEAGYLGIILGHKSNTKRVPLSFVYGFIVYYLSQFIMLGFIFIVGIFDKNIMSIFTSNAIITGSNLIKFFILTAIAYTLSIAIINICCVKLLNKGVNIE